MTTTALSTRDALLKAARELLEQGGRTAVTLRAIGGATGVSQTTPYRHFENKQDLLQHVATAFLGDMEKAMRAGADSHENTDSALAGACLGYVKAAFAHPHHYQLLFGDEPINEPSPALEAAADSCVSYLASLVAGIRGGTSATLEDLRSSTALIWSSLHGVVVLTLTGHLREPRMIDGEKDARTLVESLVSHFKR